MSDERLPPISPADPDYEIVRDGANTSSEGAEDPEQIRADIEQTRADMSDTIEAIQQRLSPEHIKDQVTQQVKEQFQHATETVREATIGKAEEMVQNVSDTANEVRYSIMDAVQQNPVPAALVGIGLGWLFINSRNNSRPSYSYDRNYTRINAYDDRNRYRTSQPYSGTQDYTGRGYDYQDQSSGGTVERARDAAGNFIDQAQETVQDVADQAQYQARRAVRSVGNTANDVRGGLFEIVEQNPLPAALAGISLGWLYLNSRNDARRPTSYGAYGSGRSIQAGYNDRSSGRTTRFSNPYDYANGGSNQGQGGIRDVVNQTQDTVGNVVGQVQDTVGNVVGQAQDTASNIANQTRDTAENLAYQAQYQAQRVEDRFQRALYENPMAVGVTAVALGMGLGLALPQTQRENELMGEARDNLVGKAQEAAQDTIQKVQNVAGQVVDDAQTTVKQEARNQGLTSP